MTNRSLLPLRRAHVVAAALCLATMGAAPPEAAGAQATGPASVSDLPLVEVPVSKPGELLAVLMTGDGGWAGGDKGLAAALAARGVPVVALKSPAYLTRPRTPDATSEDLARILAHYLTLWHRERAVVIGYSRGAVIVPFMVSRLPAAVRGRVAEVALLGPSAWAGFQFHLMDLLRDVHRPSDLPVEPEIARLRGTVVLCVYGRTDRDAICPTLPPGAVQSVVRGGGHEITGREGPWLAQTVLDAVPAPP